MMPDPPGPPPPAPPPPDARETCFHHHDRETGRHCTRCGRPACGECLHQASVGSQCWECIRAARPPTTERVRRSLAGRPLIATQILIAMNVVVFFLTNGVNGTTSNPQLVRWGELTYEIGGNGEWWRLITSGFIHFGVVHILFNMLALYFIGIVLEPGIGPWRFTAIYGASLLAGSLGGMLFQPVNVLGGGASGAVFGVGAAATVIMARRGIRFWDTGFGPLLLINIVADLFLAGISIGAHIGGAIGGALIGWVMVETAGRRYGQWAGYVAALVVGVLSFAVSIAYAHARVT
jgi:membrane associated rhomboid family serine protease